MNTEHILLIDDLEGVCSSVAAKLQNKYGERYNIAKFLSGKEAVAYAQELDQLGHKVVLVISDEKMVGMQGHEILEYFSKTHPRAKKILNSAWSVEDALKSAINSRVDGFFSKIGKQTMGEELYTLTDKLISEYESEPSLEFKVGSITFCQADTLHKKNLFASVRYKVYLQEGHKTEEMFRPEEIENKKEWDESDLGGIDALILTPRIRYLLAIKDNECIGGVRIIDGNLPMETGIYVESGFGFENGQRLNLQEINEKNFPDIEFYKREISRLIVHPNHRKSYALFGLFRMVEQLTKGQPTMMCTSKDTQLGLYSAVGFEQIAPKIRYSLAGEWTPLMRVWWKAHHEQDALGMSEKSKRLHKMVTEPLPAKDVKKWAEYSQRMNNAVVELGYYNG